MNDKEGRRNNLEQDFYSNIMPCNGCHIEDVCKYKNAIKRFDYPPVFKPVIECTIKDKYK